MIIMITQVGLLRGLNVGGKNKVSMAELKQLYTELGYQQVNTIGNTGVVFFQSAKKVDDQLLAQQLTESLGLDIKLVTLTYQEIMSIKESLPTWWNVNKDWRHNVLFLLPNFKDENFLKMEAIVDPEIEQVKVVEGAIFWSSSFKERKDFYQSHYHKLLKKNAYTQVTIRNGNTLAKIFTKIDEIEKTRDISS